MLLVYVLSKLTFIYVECKQVGFALRHSSHDLDLEERYVPGRKAGRLTRWVHGSLATDTSLLHSNVNQTVSL